MDSRGKERHMFPGSNTSEGFFSYYDYILPQREAEHIFCVKGGPGVGKSTFMTRTANALSESGVDTEYLHCSSDPESLDGVLFPKLKIAIIDGTAPHVIDPKNPGAVDEIVNLGECWRLDGIKQHKKQIIDINEEVGRLFRRAYRYLKAAKNVLDDIADLCRTPETAMGERAQAEMIIEKELPQERSVQQETRRMFGSAITPSGVVHHIETLIDDTYKKYLVTNNWGAGVNELLERIADAACASGLYTEGCYCPMDPAGKLEHLIIPGAKLAFLSENEYITLNIKPDAIIDLTQYTNGCDREDKRVSEKEFDTLLTEAIFTLRRAKETHDEMEKYYVPNMDFDKVERVRQGIMERIMKFVK